jgi:hypothetical protein
MTNTEYPLKSEQELRMSNLRLRFTNEYETHIRPIFVSKTRNFLSRGLRKFEESYLDGGFEFNSDSIQNILTNVIFDYDKSLYDFVINKMMREVIDNARQVIQEEFSLLVENGYTCEMGENGLKSRIM